MFSEVNPFKRILDQSEIETKRFKQETISHLDQMPFDILQILLTSLDPSSVLRFEMTSKKWQTLLNPVWKAKKIEDLYDFEWQMTRKEPNPDKWDYVLSCALHKYIIIDKFSSARNIDLESAQTIYRKYGGLMNRFPMLGVYIQEDIKTLAQIEIIYSNADNKKNFAIAVLEDYAGELILNGLISSRTFGTLNFECFKRAIKKKAVFASQIFLEISIPFCKSDSMKTFQWDLATEAAIQNDTRSLSQLVNTHGLNGLIQHAKETYMKEKWLEADTLFNYTFFISNKPNSILIQNAAFTKLKLKKWEECDRLYTFLFDKYVHSQSSRLLSYAAFAKSKLHLWKEADTLYTQSLIAWGDHSPSASNLNNAAHTKLKLNLWLEADQLYTRALIAYGENPLLSCLSNAAFVKLRLKQYKEADLLYTRAIQIYGQNAPQKVLFNAQSAKQKLENVAQ
jgi:tetratricopeptide (TPR) repeat protein